MAGPTYRKRLFISYSHGDKPWLERLKLHLSILERRGLVDVWSDTRIGVGEQWRTEIEDALTGSRIALLLITPGFLGSKFIWSDEMPRILAHMADGMFVIPLIARPCAWRIAPELAALQARPVDGRALSLGGEADVDRDLAALTYEIAASLEQMSSAMASEETDRLRGERAEASREAQRPMPDERRASEGASQTPPESRCLHVGQTWTGSYDATSCRMRLSIEHVSGTSFQGRMDYPDRGSVTTVQGQTFDAREVLANTSWRAAAAGVSVADAGIRFTETSRPQEGMGTADEAGEYRGFIVGSAMRGVWLKNKQALGKFEFRCDE